MFGVRRRAVAHGSTGGQGVARFLASIFTVLTLGMACSNTFAYSECTSKIAKIWNGDDGNNWLFFENGLNAMLIASDADTKGITTAATAALLAGKSVTIRFGADGVPCNTSGNFYGANGARGDVWGLFLNQN
jgi:hypothetical protein